MLREFAKEDFHSPEYPIHCGTGSYSDIEALNEYLPNKSPLFARILRGLGGILNNTLEEEVISRVLRSKYGKYLFFQNYIQPIQPINWNNQGIQMGKQPILPFRCLRPIPTRMGKKSHRERAVCVVCWKDDRNCLSQLFIKWLLVASIFQ